MKKTLIIFLIAIFPLGIFAQQDSSLSMNTGEVLLGKKGIPILPKAGDFAIGVDVIPYINFLGSTFSSGGNSLHPITSNTLFGKYYLDNNTAVRLLLFSAHYNSTSRNYVADDAALLIDPLSNAQVVDVMDSRDHSYGIGVGYQKYRGYGRLRGTYGVQLSYWRDNNETEHTWGNEMNPLNSAPSSTISWNPNVLGNPTSRPLINNESAINTIGIGAIAGVEYFILPKICIGGEVSLNYGYGWSKQSNETSEEIQVIGGTPSRIEVVRATSPGNSGSSITTNQYSTHNVIGTIYVLFHF